MATNTNNSLSDLTNNDLNKFNKMLSDDDIKKTKESTSSDSEKEGVNNLYKTSANDADKKKYTDKLDKINQKKTQENTSLSSTQIDTFTKNDNPISLFDRNAYIDYARYIKSDGTVEKNWKEYNKDSNGDYTVNNKLPINKPVPFKDNSLDLNDGLSIPSLIAWSEKYPALQLRYQDFVYCKKLGYYPNNRLIVLRRFKGGVPDNLFDYYRTDTSKVQFTQPLATMITWLDPKDDIIDMTFNEKWKNYEESFINTVKNIFTNYKLSDKKKEDSNNNEGFEDLMTSLSIEELTKVFGNGDYRKEDGVPFTRSGIGNPNLIREAKRKDSLESKITFKLTFEYELRYINDIDPSIAMLDLISNALRMGTSESEFKYNIPFLKESDLVKSFINGDMSKATEMFEKNIKKFTTDIQSKLQTLMNGLKEVAGKVLSTEGVKDIASNALTYIVSRYREDLKASLAVDTGLPSGIWHVSVGAPKNPIISCGDLIITKSELKLGKEFGYNDFPNSFEVIYTLESARSRGRQELIRIMNSGRGRLYVYPKSKDNPDYDLY